MAEPPTRHGREIEHVIAYGQSLSVGYEGWPALSLAQHFDSLMLGESVRGRSEAAPHWQPVGPAAFRPLVATVQSIATGALLDAEAVAGLPREAAELGETVLEGALNFWRARRPAGNLLLASACGVGGRSLEELSKGAQPELFNRLRDCIRCARAAAEAQGFGYRVAALLFLQGESNNWRLNGATADPAGYAALLRRFHRDAVADICALSGQAEPPTLLLYQTGGAYASDSQSVPQAQLDFASATPGCVMVGPHYAVSEKGGHLDANGYRWLGQQFGKVLHHVRTLGRQWRPLHPLWAEWSGQTVTVAFQVPVPPLRWGRPMIGQGFADPAERGFSVLDAAGRVPLAAVELDGPDRVRLELARMPVGAVTLRYADRPHGGRGALHDSDATPATECYVYDAASGHRPAANVVELVGRPYPLHNWCVAFAIPAPPAEDLAARMLAALPGYQ